MGQSRRYSSLCTQQFFFLYTAAQFSLDEVCMLRDFEFLITPFFSLDAVEHQNFLDDFLASLGKRAIRGGVCFGFNETLSDDFFDGKHIAFFQRLALMYYRVQVHKSAAKYFQHFRQKEENARAEGLHEEADAIAAELKDIDDFANALSKDQAPVHFPEQSNGRYLGQTQKLLRQAVVEPHEPARVAISRETPYIAMFHTKITFKALLLSLHEKHPHDLTVTLSMEKHATTLLHKHQENQWLYVNSNALYDLAFTRDLEAIANDIFKQREAIVCGASVKVRHTEALTLEDLKSTLIVTQAAVTSVSKDLFVRACELGDLTRVKRLWEKDKQGTSRVLDDNSLYRGLVSAAAYNQLEVVQYLHMLVKVVLSESEYQSCMHAALGEALKYGAVDVIDEFLDVFPEFPTAQNEAYEEKTIVMLAAGNPVSLKHVLERLDASAVLKRRGVLSAVDKDRRHTLYYARMQRASLELLLPYYLADDELRKSLRDIHLLQVILLDFMPYPSVLAYFIQALSEHPKLRPLLKFAVTDTITQAELVNRDLLQFHPLLIASASHQDAITPLLAFLTEEERVEHLQEKLGNVYEGMGFDDTPDSTRRFVDIEKLSSLMSQVSTGLPKLTLIEVLVLYYPERLSLVFQSLSEEHIARFLLMKCNLGEVSLSHLNALMHAYPIEVQAELREKQEAISEELREAAVHTFIQSTQVQLALSKLIHTHVKNATLRAQLEDQIAWLKLTVREQAAPDEHAKARETFKTLLPHHAAMRTWFNELTREVRLQLFKYDGELLLHAPLLLEQIFNDATTDEQEAFRDVIIENQHHVNRCVGMRAYQMLITLLGPEHISRLIIASLMPNKLGIVTFFLMREEARSLLCESLNADQTYGVLTHPIAPSGQSTFQILLEDPGSASWSRDYLQLLTALMKRLPSQRATGLLMEHPLAVHRFRQREPELYQQVLSRLERADRHAIKERYNTYVFLDGEFVPRPSGYGAFKTLDIPALHPDSDAEDDNRYTNTCTA